MTETKDSRAAGKSIIKPGIRDGSIVEFNGETGKVIRLRNGVAYVKMDADTTGTLFVSEVDNLTDTGEVAETDEDSINGIFYKGAYVEDSVTLIRGFVDSARGNFVRVNLEGLVGNLLAPQAAYKKTVALQRLRIIRGKKKGRA